MRLIDADRLLSDRMKSKYYLLPNGDTAIPIIDIEHAPTVGGWIFEPGKFVAEIAAKYAETMDEFIFQTISPYCEEITQRSISKHDLVCALTQYFKGGWTAFEVLDIISSAYWGKQLYFLQENGLVYDRKECDCVPFDTAVNRFARMVGNDG